MSRSRKSPPSTAAAGNPAAPAAPIPLSRGSPGLWLLLALITGGVYLTFYVWPGLLWYAGVQHYDVWFADTLALLASSDAAATGFNPYAPNPLDVFQRPHVYSHWWLQLSSLGLTREDLVWLGPAVVGAFWLAAFHWLRPRSVRQLAFHIAVLVASPMLLALDRANNDLVVFLVLTPLVPCLLSPRPWVRLLAPLLVAAAAGLKYFPAAAGLVLLAAAPPRELRWRLIAGMALLVVVGLSVAPDLARFGPLAPKPSGWMSFGAASAFTTLGWTGAGATATCLAGAAVLLAWGWCSPRLDGWTPRPEQQREWLGFVLGAALLCGCFFTSANFSYRWVFAVWLAPFLWTLGADAAAPAGARRLANATRWLLLAALWLDTFFSWVVIAGRGHLPTDLLRAWVKWSFLGEQPVIWALFGCLLWFLARFTRDGLRRLASAA